MHTQHNNTMQDELGDISTLAEPHVVQMLIDTKPKH